MTLDKGACWVFLIGSHASVFDVPLAVAEQGVTNDIAVLS